jgi:AhpD family alkylhydroperoxidase
MEHETYPERYERLQRLFGRLGRAIPEEMAGFAKLHRSAVADGALPAKMRELIALGLAIGSHCEGCIAYHVHDALAAGATEDEVLDAIGVAVMMGGGPGAVYGAEALAALEQFQAAGAPPNLGAVSNRGGDEAAP